jgi:branched-chain amino acid transport system substrate-binding protein
MIHFCHEGKRGARAGRYRILVSSMCASALLVAAAGFSSSGGGSPAGATTPGVTKGSITVEGLLTKTSSAGYSFADADLGAKALFKQVNAAGGVNGRKINYLGSRDDGGDPTQGLPLSKSIVEQDHAFAVVPVVSPTFAPTYLEQQKIPFFGWGINPAFCNNNYGFGMNGCVVPAAPKDLVMVAPATVVAKALGDSNGKGAGKTVALITNDDSAGTSGLNVVKAAYVAAGFKVVYAEASVPDQPVSDWSPYVSAVLKANNGQPPDVMGYGTQLPDVIGMRAAMNQAGFKGISVDPVAYAPILVQSATTSAGLQNEYVALQFAPFEAGTPAMNKMKQAILAVGGTSANFTEAAAVGYWSAALFVAALKKAGSNPTRASLTKALNSGFSYGVPGGLGTVSFPKDHTAVTPCSSLVQIRGKRYVQSVPLTCGKNVPVGS